MKRILFSTALCALLIAPVGFAAADNVESAELTRCKIKDRAADGARFKAAGDCEEVLAAYKAWKEVHK